MPHLRNTGIVVDLILAAVLLKLFGREHIFELIGVASHAAEFGDKEIFSVLADARMAIKHGTAVAQLDGKRQNEKEPGKKQQHDARRENVERALEKQIALIFCSAARKRGRIFRVIVHNPNDLRTESSAYEYGVQPAARPSAPILKHGQGLSYKLPTKLYTPYANKSNLCAHIFAEVYTTL